MKPDTSLHRRSFLKGFSWESVSLTLTFGIAWLVFGHARTCAMFTAVSFFVKLFFFYLHERIWHQISYGKRHNETLST